MQINAQDAAEAAQEITEFQEIDRELVLRGTGYILLIFILGVSTFRRFYADLIIVMSFQFGLFHVPAKMHGISNKSSLNMFLFNTLFSCHFFL